MYSAMKSSKNTIKMENEIKLATWNMCIGLCNKKEYLTEMIKMSNIYICCMQKIDIPIGYNVSPHNNQ